MPKTRGEFFNNRVVQPENQMTKQESYKQVGKRKFYDLLTKGIITAEEFDIAEQSIDSDTTEYENYSATTYYTNILNEIYTKRGLDVKLIDRMNQYNLYAKDDVDDPLNLESQAMIIGSLSLSQNASAYKTIIENYPKVAQFIKRDVALAEKIGLVPVNAERERIETDRLNYELDMINRIAPRRP